MSGAQLRCAIAAFAAIMLMATASRAQTIGGRFDAGVGVQFTGSMTLARVNATETSSGGGHRTVFASETSLESSAGGSIWFTARLTPLFGAEGAVTVSSPGLATAITNDVEGAANTTAREDLRQYSFEAGVGIHPAPWRRLSWSPFITAGGGYLRQLHEGHVLVETGTLFYAGFGLQYTMRSRARGPRPGVRADVRAAFMKDGVAFDDAIHGAPQFSLSAFVRF